MDSYHTICDRSVCNKIKIYCHNTQEYSVANILTIDSLCCRKCKTQSNTYLLKCDYHGYYTVDVDKYVRGYCCSLCIRVSSKKYLPFQSYKEIANYKFNNKYEYTRVDHNKIKITCEKHGDITLGSGRFILGSGCPKCVVEYEDTTYEEFLEYSKLLYGDYFTYSNFTDIQSLLKVKCRYHSDIEVNGDYHLLGFSKCPNCTDIKELKYAKLIKDINLGDYQSIYGIKNSIIHAYCQKHSIDYYTNVLTIENNCLGCTMSIQYESSIGSLSPIHDINLID